MSVNVLVVDDSKVERMYLAGLLERLGVQSDTAESSEEAVLRACEEPFDMFFIDYFMPDADGVHALKEIRSNESTLNAETPAVALGTADPVLGEDFFIMQGFVNYLEKPVGFEMLHAALLLYLPEEKRAEIGNGELTVDGGEQDSVILRWLSDIPEMNVADGVKNCGSEEGFMSALEIFFKSVGKMSDEIQGYYDSGNWTDYTIKVHALKSSARIIGLAELSELARQLEAAGDAKDLGFIHDNTGNMNRSFLRFPVMKPLMTTPASPLPNPISSRTRSCRWKSSRDKWITIPWKWFWIHSRNTGSRPRIRNCMTR